MLTAKQEQFARNIVAGMTAKDAYKAAYNTNASEQVIYNESAKLLKRADIEAYIKELQKPLVNHAQSKALSEYDRIKSLLWDRIDHCVASGDDAAIARYSEILNKMNHTYININKEITDDKTNIENLDNVTLLKLVQ